MGTLRGIPCNNSLLWPWATTWLHDRPIRLTQCCTQFRSLGFKILCALYLHYKVAFTFKWYGNSRNKTFYSQMVWIGYNIELAELVYWERPFWSRGEIFGLWTFLEIKVTCLKYRISNSLWLLDKKNPCVSPAYPLVLQKWSYSVHIGSLPC